MHARARPGYSGWVCVCLSGQDKLLRLLTPAGYGSYRLYMANARLDFAKNVRIESYDDKYLYQLWSHSAIVVILYMHAC